MGWVGVVRPAPPRPAPGSSGRRERDETSGAHLEIGICGTHLTRRPGVFSTAAPLRRTGVGATKTPSSKSSFRAHTRTKRCAPPDHMFDCMNAQPIPAAASPPPALDWNPPPSRRPSPALRGSKGQREPPPAPSQIRNPRSRPPAPPATPTCPPKLDRAAARAPGGDCLLGIARGRPLGARPGARKRRMPPVLPTLPSLPPRPPQRAGRKHGGPSSSSPEGPRHEGG